MEKAVKMSHPLVIRLSPIWLFLMLVALPACSSLSKIPLRHRSDHLDDRALGDTGQTPRFQAPQGLILDLNAVYAQDGDEASTNKKAIFVTFSLRNNSDQALSFDWRKWWLRSDDGRRFSPSKMEVYDEDTGKYAPAPTKIAPGKSQVMTLTIPTGSRLRIELTITLVLHWRFQHGKKRHSIATFFQVT